MSDGSLVQRVVGKTLPTAKVELTDKTVKDLTGIVGLLGSMYIVGGLIRILK